MFTQSNFFSSPILASLPPQMVSKSKKDKKWREDCMDALESVGRNQFQRNMRLIENYEMIKGKFIPGHYFDQAEHQDMLGRLTQEFNLPAYLRHYDICSPIINTLSGEWQNRPDTFRVKGQGEHTDNEYLRAKSTKLQEYVVGKIKAEVAQKLLAAGLDENGGQNLPPDQVQQYQQMVEEARQKLTPPQIEQYMKTDWMTAAEMWGQHQLELNKKRFRQVEKEKREFEDMLIADRCFRHFYLTADGRAEETWNPVNTFFHKSPDVDFVEEGDYVGRVFYLTVPAIIDRYGHRMTKKEIEALQEETKKTDSRWNYSTGSEYVFENYMFPFRDYPAYDIMRQTSPFAQPSSDNNIPYLDANFFSSLYSGKYFAESKGYYLVVEAYWKSQRKIGKVTYIDPETGVKTKMLIDEDVVIPSHFKQLDSNFVGDSDEVDTVVWTWINEVWKGIKINTKHHSGFNEDIYLDVQPLEFQLKGDLNPYGAKLPVCGQVFSPRNSESMSLVDLIKPHQIGYNVAMNQAYQEMQKDVGKFIIMDVNLFADRKDWGGEQAYEKFMLIAKELGVTVIDTSPSNTQGANAAGGQYPKEIDLDASARILSRLKIAEAFEAFAHKQIGFNEYRLGQQASTATAEGIRQGEQRSFAQTESYFTNFSGYLQRCHKMGLDMDQYVQSQEKDITVSYIKSDLSRAFIKLNGSDLLLSDLHVYVWNSQEEIRQLEALRQLALSNNTMGASFKDLADVITSNSPAEIRQKLQGSQDRMLKMQERQMQIQEQQIQGEQEIKQAELQEEARQFDVEWGEGGTRERIAYMQSFNRQIDNNADEDLSGVPDILEYDKLAQKAEAEEGKTQIQREKLQLDRENAQADREIKKRDQAIAEKKINADLEIQQKELESVKILKKQEKPKPPAKKKK